MRSTFLALVASAAMAIAANVPRYAQERPFDFRNCLCITEDGPCHCGSPTSTIYVKPYPNCNCIVSKRDGSNEQCGCGINKPHPDFEIAEINPEDDDVTSTAVVVKALHCVCPTNEDDVSQGHAYPCPCDGIMRPAMRRRAPHRGPGNCECYDPDLGDGDSTICPCLNDDGFSVAQPRMDDSAGFCNCEILGSNGQTVPCGCNKPAPDPTPTPKPVNHPSIHCLCIIHNLDGTSRPCPCNGGQDFLGRLTFA